MSIQQATLYIIATIAGVFPCYWFGSILSKRIDAETWKLLGGLAICLASLLLAEYFALILVSIAAFAIATWLGWYNEKNPPDYYGG